MTLQKYPPATVLVGLSVVGGVDGVGLELSVKLDDTMTPEYRLRLLDAAYGELKSHLAAKLKMVVR